VVEPVAGHVTVDDASDAARIGEVDRPVAQRAHECLPSSDRCVGGVLLQALSRVALKRLVAPVFTGSANDTEAVGKGPGGAQCGKGGQQEAAC
jgi:hypothetical protein